MEIVSPSACSGEGKHFWAFQGVPVPTGPEGGSAGSPSMHRLLGQGQSIQCKPLGQPSHSLTGIFS